MDAVAASVLPTPRLTVRAARGVRGRYGIHGYQGESGLPVNYANYPAGWHEFSRWIREERAGNRCEWCDVPNHVYRNEDGDVTTDDMLAESWACVDGLDVAYIVLTVAHLDHDHTHKDPERVAALCQRCHNRLDAPIRAHRRRYGADYDGAHQGNLFGG